MDAFYASVEQRDNPELRGKPLVVGGSTNRGVVAAASYESREYGIRSAMPMAEAARRCPDLVRVRPRMPVYRAVSRDVFGVFAEFTPLVEGLSLDEAFLDVSASLKLFGAARDIAVAIKKRIREHTGLTASVGLAENKLVAKIASDLDKPDGLTVVMPGDYRRVLDPLPVSVIPGIGRETLARLHKLDIRTVAGLRVAARNDLQKVFGRFAASMQVRAAGIDDRPVVPAREEKSISAEETYSADLVRRVEMEKELLRLADKVAGRLRKAGLCASTIQVKIRQSDFSTSTRQKTLHHGSNGTDDIYSVARQLLGGWMAEHRGARVRLLGVGGSNLEKAGQADLFAADGDGKSAPLDSMVDEIRDRFGTAAVERARTMDKS
ncbi:MAG: DNA polymerase IV [Gammaproteobacteria bacterium]|nr:DNA polymerase IV [Gammaproteobacteria bacterium]